MPLRTTELPPILLLATVLFGLSHEASASEQYTSRLMKRTIEGQQLRYLLLPPVIPVEGKAPLLVFLHGSGERGDDVKRVLLHGPAKHRHEVPELQTSFLLLPLCPSDQWWNPNVLMHLFNEVITEYSSLIDRRRIYLTGLSMGGYGTWDLLSKSPNFFAAAAPICGGGDLKSLMINLKITTKTSFRYDDLKALTQTPVWAHHGKLDKAVPYTESKKLTQIIKSSGNQDVLLTIYEDIGHDSWNVAYKNRELYRWLYGHELSRQDQAPIRRRPPDNE